MASGLDDRHADRLDDLEELAARKGTPTVRQRIKQVGKKLLVARNVMGQIPGAAPDTAVALQDMVTAELDEVEMELEKLGARVTLTETDVRIEPPAKVEPARIATYDDHRMAMSFAVAGLRVPGIVIERLKAMQQDPKKPLQRLIHDPHVE